jgi:hypothetical protein
MMRYLVALGMCVVLAAAFTVAHARAAGQSCQYAVSPVWIDAAPAGQNGSITIDTQPGCAWTAMVDGTGLTIDQMTGAGPATVSYTASAVQVSERIRQRRVRIRWNTPTAGQDVVLTQKLLPCRAIVSFGAFPYARLDEHIRSGRRSRRAASGR